ncbi:MAG: hypothetical protein PHW24_01325 [Candidatus Moranbacteria bacterium]|jgi:hypothetical protein|nr:hypothetical protein [Candidatus Moranbacteria bacterium]
MQKKKQRLVQKLVDYLRGDHAGMDLTDEEIEVIGKALSILVEKSLININENELVRVTTPPSKPMPIRAETKELIMGAIVRMLHSDLDHFNDDKLKGKQTLDFGERIRADLEIPKKYHEQMRSICLEKGWEVQEISGLVIKVNNIKRVKKK